MCDPGDRGAEALRGDPRAYRTGAMQGLTCGLPRTPLLGRWCIRGAEAVLVLRGPRYEPPREVAVLKVRGHGVVDLLIRVPGHVDETPAVLRVHHHHVRVRWSADLARLLRQKLGPLGAIGVRVRDQEGVELLTGFLAHLVEGRLDVLLLGGAQRVRLVEDRVRPLRRGERREEHRRYRKHQNRDKEPRDHPSSLRRSRFTNYTCEEPEGCEDTTLLFRLTAEDRPSGGQIPEGVAYALEDDRTFGAF